MVDLHHQEPVQNSEHYVTDSPLQHAAALSHNLDTVAMETCGFSDAGDLQ